MSEVGRGVVSISGGIRTPRGSPDPQKVKKCAKESAKNSWESVEFEPVINRSKVKPPTLVPQGSINEDGKI